MHTSQLSANSPLVATFLKNTLGHTAQQSSGNRVGYDDAKLRDMKVQGVKPLWRLEIERSAHGHCSAPPSSPCRALMAWWTCGGKPFPDDGPRRFELENKFRKSRLRDKQQAQLAVLTPAAGSRRPTRHRTLGLRRSRGSLCGRLMNPLHSGMAACGGRHRPLVSTGASLHLISNPVIEGRAALERSDFEVRRVPLIFA